MKLNIQDIIAKINIVPVDSSRIQMNVDMPVWLKQQLDGLIEISMPLFGGLTTFAENQNDIDAAIREALTLYFKAVIKHGNGIDEELSMLGWQRKKNTIRFKSSSFYVPRNPMMSEMMKTGTPKKLQLTV